MVWKESQPERSVNWGFATYQAADYLKSDSIFAIYEEKYPKEIFDRGGEQEAWLLYDSTGEKAVPHYEKFIEVAKALTAAQRTDRTVLVHIGRLCQWCEKDKDAALELPGHRSPFYWSNQRAGKSILIFWAKPAPKTSTPQSRPRFMEMPVYSGGNIKVAKRIYVIKIALLSLLMYHPRRYTAGCFLFCWLVTFKLVICTLSYILPLNQTWDFMIIKIPLVCLPFPQVPTVHTGNSSLSPCNCSLL